MSKISEFEAKLDEALKGIDQEWLNSLTESWIDWAEFIFAALQKKYADHNLELDYNRSLPYQLSRQISMNERMLQQRFLKGKSLDLDAVKSYAKREFQDIRSQYIVRATNKVKAVSEGREIAALNLNVALTSNNLISGTATVSYVDGNEVSVSASVRWNRSKYGKMFVQYPFHLSLNGEKKSYDDLLENFSLKKKEEKSIPERVEGEKAVKAAANLAFNLANQGHLQAIADKRNLRGYGSGVRGPQGAITRALNFLGLPEGITAKQAVQLLWNSLTAEQKTELEALHVADDARAPAGKKGKALRDIRKSLEKLELVCRSSRVRLTNWGRQLIDLAVLS